MYTIKKANNEQLWGIAAALIRELAVYESLGNICTAKPEDIKKLFKENILQALIAFDETGEPAGLLTYFYMVSTFKGKKVIYMDDLFIREKQRGHKLGKTLMNELTSIANNTDCCKIEWKCLVWNDPAQQFYEKFGGKKDEENFTYYKIL
ncbi:GNAT family N-acetyltransferase [Pectinatus frisingensis]|uniref:GNAT family N-acetyltransferase n=1 Tax=Pectinatus frisingensis TaxID=865 RepID=UPI0015F4875C|nr:GNAT family N-acetyltransferase [Pectinatus frisingensis]